ncbi:MAG: hypothetical protein EOP54_14715 [Sphingobacteriales bacterium]|nr:MAG: hypothetical protein EOP54_14715 [Sphingobacteriales bacterium]
MTLILLRLLFFCLTPIGIFILIKGIKMIRKAFNGDILLSIPYLENGGKFSVTKAGNFSVWQKGKAFRRTPVDKFKLRIYEESTNEEVALKLSILRPETNNFSTARMELYWFYAPVGTYSVSFNAGSNISGFEGLAGNMIPLPPADLSKYFIEIRTSQSPLITLLAIPVILLGGLGIAGGLVLGLLADRII